jgi:signal transduction histidine kinase/DNA-binding NarL/FixJ family response regulator
MVSADLELLRRPGETSFECKVSGSDGGERTFAVRKASYEDEPGEIGGFIGVMTEITEYKRLEGELRRALNAAESANRAKSAFLAQMSHELRTPMNAIVGTAELLAETGDPVQGERLSMLREAAGTLMELLGNVLDLSRIESGKFVLVEEPFDPLSVCSQVLSILAPEAEGKGLSFRLDPTGFTGGIFRGDGPRLRQVLMNLTGNAVKYTERGEVVLSLRALSREDGRVALFFAVRDTGIGIEPSQVQRVFDYFSQGEEALTRRFPGAGLGLAIARQIVRAMGGDINLVSRPGEGSTFSFSVTLTPGGTLPTVKETGPRRRRADLPKGLKVLVAEDNPLNRRLLKALLERYSWDLRMAPDGEEALRLFREEPFDLALLDIQMPKVDGYRVAREIREIEVRQGREPMPLVALSAYAMKGDRERCLEAGMDDYLPKPVTPEALRRTLGDALAGSPPVFEEPLYRKLTEGNEEVMSEGAEELLKLLPPLEEGLVSALESGNSEEAARLAHRIKGSVAYFGSRIASEAKALEVLLREGDLDRARARAPRLLALSARLAVQVRRRFSPGDGPRTD